MRQRIAAHVDRRGEDWTTIEEPIDLAKIVGSFNSGDVVLIDCLTLWLTNILLADLDTDAAGEDLVRALSASRAHLICVSNETGMGLVPENFLGRRFRDAQGTLNQRIAAVSDTVVFVAAGLPLVLKGSIEGRA